MNRRTYLQTLGAAVGTATIASAGAAAAEGDGIPDAVREAPVGASDAKVPDVPDDAIDVRDHGAQLDGSTDDRDALQSALNAASSSNGTVYVPEGELVVDGRVFFRERHNGVTLLGSGSGTHIRLSGGHDDTQAVFHILGENDPIQNLTITSLRVDGNKDQQSHKIGWGIVTYHGGFEAQDLQIQNVWVQDCAGSGLMMNAAGAKIQDVSVWGAGKWHGVGTGADGGEPMVFDGVHVYDNSVHGFDCSNGNIVVRNSLSEANGWGAKNTKETGSCEWQSVVFRNNDHHGFMIPDSTDGEITFDNVVAEGNGWSGFRFARGGTIDIGTLAARNNDSTGRGDGNIYIGGPVDIQADTIYSYDSHTSGLVFHDYDGGPSGVIETYSHGGNDGETVRGGRASLTVETVTSGEYPDIDPLGGDAIEPADVDTSGDLPVTGGLVLSLNAGAGVSASDGRVTEWVDQSGRGNDLSANGDPTLSTTPTGAQAISFDGDGDELVRTGELDGFPTDSAPRTMFVVGKYESTGFGGVSYGRPSWNNTFGTVVDSGGELTVQGWSSRNDYPSGVAGTSAGWLTQSITYDGSQFVHYQNGTKIGSDTHSFTTSDDKLAIGAELDASPYLDMEVGAVVLYDRVLSDTERQEVEQHLQNRYLNDG